MLVIDAYDFTGRYNGWLIDWLGGWKSKYQTSTGLLCSEAICYTGLILGLRPANERRRYNETPSLIGWAQS